MFESLSIHTCLEFDLVFVFSVPEGLGVVVESRFEVTFALSIINVAIILLLWLLCILGTSLGSLHSVGSLYYSCNCILGDPSLCRFAIF